MKIAVVGKMRSGKDTFAKFLVDTENAWQLAFANEIKIIIRNAFPEIMEQGKPRHLYQKIGQTFREIDSNVWINLLDKHYQYLSEIGVKNFVISDVRQMNEYLYLKEQGFTVVKVEADDELRKQRILEAGDLFIPEDFYHETETAVDSIPYDYVLYNNGTLEEFKYQMETVYKLLKEKEDAE